MQIPQKIAAFFLLLSKDPRVIISLILLLLLGIGMFMDINAARIILIGPPTREFELAIFDDTVGGPYRIRSTGAFDELFITVNQHTVVNP